MSDSAMGLASRASSSEVERPGTVPPILPHDVAADSPSLHRFPLPCPARRINGARPPGLQRGSEHWLLRIAHGSRDDKLGCWRQSWKLIFLPRCIAWLHRAVGSCLGLVLR